DQRSTARVSELPQESDLEYRIYNGRYNVDVLLSDVRVGDVVEWSYTVRSKSLVFADHFAARLDTGWSIPVHRQRIRVVAPLDRRLQFRASDGTPLPEPVVRDGRRELVREWRDVPAR